MTTYEKVKEEVMKDLEKVEKLKPHLDIIDQIKKEFEDDKNYDSISLTAGFGIMQIQGAIISVTVKDTKFIVPIARKLVELGYHSKGFSDYAELSRRTYDYGDIKLSMFLSSGEDSKCKFVIDGYEQKPKYKLVCGEETTKESAEMV